MDYDMIVNSLFESKTGVASFHDSIFQACNVSHNDETLQLLFYQLPFSIQQTALNYGLSDTVFGDAVYIHVKKLGEKNGKNEAIGS